MHMQAPAYVLLDKMFAKEDSYLEDLEFSGTLHRGADDHHIAAARTSRLSTAVLEGNRFVVTNFGTCAGQFRIFFYTYSKFNSYGASCAMVERAPSDYVVLGLDIIKYSQKTLLLQKLAQERVDRCLDEALNETLPEGSPMPHWIDAGDGGYALFQWAELEVLELLKEFYKRIHRENNDASEASKIHVRAAIHKDKVVVWDTKIGGRQIKKFTGHAINNCARLMAGMIKDHTQQVVCSRPVLDALMMMDQNVSATRLRDVVDKHGNPHEVWNIKIVPVLGTIPIDKELFAEPLLRIYPGSPA